MTTANKLYLSVMAFIVLGGCIVNFGFVPVVVVVGFLSIPWCWYLVATRTRNFGPRYSHRAAVYNFEDMTFIRKIFNLKDGK